VWTLDPIRIDAVRPNRQLGDLDHQEDGERDADDQRGELRPIVDEELVRDLRIPFIARPNASLQAQYRRRRHALAS
jgi:hypothetical protein